MYRSILVFIFIVVAACKGETNSASAANNNSARSDSIIAGAQTSDTVGAIAGPISPTETAAPGSAAATAATTPTVSTSGSTAPAGASSGTANPNRVPNEMGRIMVLEYHLITDH
ncbi:MAG: hypothetical protein ABJB95_10335, partial [Gemmatimonadales bacterium]